MDLARLQEEVREWRDHNFPNTTLEGQTLKLMEELGEFCHAYHMREDGLRGYDQDKAYVEMRDALGDMLIVLCGMADKAHVNLDDAITETWAEVGDRDWVKYPKDGVSE